MRSSLHRRAASPASAQVAVGMLGNKVPGTEMVGSVPTAGFHVRPFRSPLVPSPLALVSRVLPCLACGAPWCLTCWAHTALRRTVAHG